MLISCSLPCPVGEGTCTGTASGHARPGGDKYRHDSSQARPDGEGGVVPARQVASRYGKKSVKNLGIEERKKLKWGTESNLQKGTASFVVA